MSPRAAVGRVRPTSERDGAHWHGHAVRAARRYLADAMPDRAASLAYYGMLSLFPSLLIVSAAVRLLGVDGAAREASEYAREHGVSGALSNTLRSALETAQSGHTSGAGLLGLAGVVSLMYGASRAFTAAGRALDTIGDQTPVGRSPARRAQDLGWTIALLTMGIASLVLLLVSGEVLGDLLGLFGLSGAAVSVWAVARWPAAFALLLFATAIIKWAAPSAVRPSFRLLAPGTIVSVSAWFVASIGFGLYVGHFASYNATYGAFAGAVILLLWIWIGGATLLYGAELDAVLTDSEETPSRAG